MAWDDLNELFWLRGEPAGAPMARGAQAGAAVASAWTQARAQREEARHNREQELAEIRRAANESVDAIRSREWLDLQQSQWQRAQLEDLRRRDKLTAFGDNLNRAIVTDGVAPSQPAEAARRIVSHLTTNVAPLIDPDTAPAASAAMSAAQKVLDMDADAAKRGKEAEIKAYVAAQLKDLRPEYAAPVIQLIKEYGEQDPRVIAAISEAGKLQSQQAQADKAKPKITFEEFAARNYSQVRQRMATERAGKVPTETEIADRLRREYNSFMGTNIPAAGDLYESFQKWKQSRK